MSNLRLVNKTSYPAQFVVRRGDLVLARIPGLAPGGQVLIPVDATYQVTAAMVLDGNTYISAPQDVLAGCCFLAQVLQDRAQGGYVFSLVPGRSDQAQALQFQKTSLAPVTFTISRAGRPLQTLVVNDSFQRETILIGHEFTLQAVINGITTDAVTTANPDACIQAIEDQSDPAFSYLGLRVESA